MLSIKLAFKNLFGAGLRTWLNVSVLSFAFFVIVFYNGMLNGWNMQARNDSKSWEFGAGQFWHPAYDRYDPFSLQDAHGPISDELVKPIQDNLVTPILLAQASVYPQGRMMSVILKGIDPGQRILALPTKLLAPATAGADIQAIIGNRMAHSTGLERGDKVTIQWRDRNGTFDARDISITEIFDTNVPAVDQGQVWISLEVLREMTGLENEATMLVVSDEYKATAVPGWNFKDPAFLLKELDEVINSKRGSSAIIYTLLMAIALLAIFDTQVLSIFRRQKEIGTLIALGMTRKQVVQIFTIEGSAYSLLAIAATVAYGTPLLRYLQRVGIPMPSSAAQTGLSIADKIIPVYGIGMVLTTIVLVVLSSTIVSYFPSRKISTMNPTDALKGKIQ